MVNTFVVMVSLNMIIYFYFSGSEDGLNMDSDASIADLWATTQWCSARYYNSACDGWSKECILIPRLELLNVKWEYDY